MNTELSNSIDFDNLPRRGFIKLAGTIVASAALSRFGRVEASPAYQEVPSEISGIILVNPNTGTQLDQNAYNSIATDNFNLNIQSLKADFDKKISNLQITLNIPKGRQLPTTDVYTGFTEAQDGTPQIQYTETPTPDGNKHNLISALFTISGMKDNKPIEGGLLYVPNDNGSWDTYYSDTPQLGFIAYGKDGFRNNVPLLVPDAKSKSLMAFQYTDVNKPSPLIAIGVPDTDTHFISWNSAKREIVQNQEFTVRTDIPMLRVTSIDQENMNKFYDILKKIPREKGVVLMPDKPVVIELNKRTPEVTKKIKRFMIDTKDTGGVGVEQTDSTELYKKYPLSPTDAWIKELYSQNNKAYKDALSIFLTYTWISQVGFDNNLFDMSYSSSQPGPEIPFLQFLKDNGFDFNVPLFSVTIQ